MKKGRRNTDKKKEPLSYKKYLHFIIILMSFLFIFVVFRDSVPLTRNVINNENTNTFTQPWKYSIDNQHEQVVNLPYFERGEIKSHILLKNQLPQEMVKGATVLFRTSQQTIRVFINHELIYDSIDLGSLPTSSYHFVRVPKDSEGKQIIVELTSPYARYAGKLNNIFIGSKTADIFHVMDIGGMQFVMGALIFVVGFILSAVFIFIKKHTKLLGIIYIGFFFIFAGFWVMSESTILQFVIPYPSALTNASVIALTLLPLLSGLYYFNIHKIENRRLEGVYTSIMGFVPLFAAISCLLDPTSPVVYLPLYLVYLSMYVLTIFALMFMHKIKGKRNLSFPIIGLFIFILCGLIEIIFYFNNIHHANSSNFLTIGLFIFCVIMLGDLASSFSKAYNDSIRVDALTILAYTDSLTGLKNRTAFLESLTKLKIQKDEYVTLFMFDINNLKPVNDSMGHLIGDAMIKHSVEAILNCLRNEDELYRMGGDEFVAVLRHNKEFNPETISERIKNKLKVEKHRVKSYDLNVAYGYAQFEEDTDIDIFATLARADKQMYACKKEQKKQEISEIQDEE